MGKTASRRPVRALRRTAWLTFGTLAGLVSGFVFALVRPRVLDAEENVATGTGVPGSCLQESSSSTGQG